MLPPDEALAAVLSAVGPLPAVSLPPALAGGLVTAEAVAASADMPPFDNSAMDGWAVRAADAAGAALAGAVMAGEHRESLAPGTAVRIMTGAPLPAGADSVVPKELGREEAGRLALDEAPEPGQHVRRRGEDARSGDELVPAGRELGPWEAGVLAAQGTAEVRVVPRPRVAVLPTGDELRGPVEPLGPGQIRDSSSAALAEAVRRWGALPVLVGPCRDERSALAGRLRHALASADAVFVTGGVSVGDRDHTRAALADCGGREVFWKTAVKPGKPLLFGLVGPKPVWGLPGNPVSSLVTAEVFARPALERMAGRPPAADPFPCRGRLGAAFEKSASLRQFVFCSTRAEGSAAVLEPLLPQNSGRLSMGVRARALAVLPEGRSEFSAGSEVRFRWL